MFAPVIIPPPAPSQRAKELGEQISLFITEYRQDNPEMSSLEIQQAFMLARQRTNKELGGSANMKPFIALGLGLAMMVLLGVFVLLSKVGSGGSGGGASNQPIVLMIAVVAAIVLFGFVAIVVTIKRNKM